MKKILMFSLFHSVLLISLAYGQQSYEDQPVIMRQVDGWTVLETYPGLAESDEAGMRILISPTSEISIMPNISEGRWCPSCSDPRYCECPGGGIPWGEQLQQSIDIFSLDFGESGLENVDPSSLTIQRYKFDLSEVEVFSARD